MKNKKIFNALLSLCAALILMGGFSVTAFAQTPEGQDDTDDSGVVYEEPQKEEPLTPVSAISKCHFSPKWNVVFTRQHTGVIQPYTPHHLPV